MSRRRPAGAWHNSFSFTPSSLVGCRGPLMVPAMQRLTPQDQAQVDGMWNNMLSTPDRLDRNLLVDVLIQYQPHENGVDCATYDAKKSYVGGDVLMVMKYDRAKPPENWFFVEIRNRDKHVIRTEHYSGDEIWAHGRELTDSVADVNS